VVGIANRPDDQFRTQPSSESDAGIRFDETDA